MFVKEVLLPAMGEGITEASIIRWLVAEGDKVIKDQPLVEIATDKVDSEIHSPSDGVLEKIICHAGSIPKVGEILAVLSIESVIGHTDEFTRTFQPELLYPEQKQPAAPVIKKKILAPQKSITLLKQASMPFVPPFVRHTALQLGIALEELAAFSNKTEGQSLNKNDLEAYLAAYGSNANIEICAVKTENYLPANKPAESESITGTYTGPYRIEPMGRLRKRIAGSMLRSSNSIPHVTSFVEADATNMVLWREKSKAAFLEKYNTKLTYTPLFVEAIVFALKQFPDVNVSVNEDNIVYKDDINIGMATILPDKDLMVPVIKKADTLSLSGLSFTINDLANRTREKSLKPDEATGSTFTFTNIGVFGSLTGTPLINMPEAAILAIGAINKKPSAVLTPDGFAIGLRDIVMLSLAYDHRVIDGGLGGQFLKCVADKINSFDINREV